MKSGIFFIIIAVIMLLCITPAYAAVYSDDDNDISIDIIYGEGVYYYTPEKNNLFNDLSQKVSSDERDVRFYVTKYNPDNSQPYAFLVTAQPLNTADSADADVFDITTFADSDKAVIVAEALSEHTADFNFTDPVDSNLGDMNALLIKGVNKDDPEDILDVYIASNGTNYIITEAQYFTSTDTTDINSLINSVQFSEELTGRVRAGDVAAAPEQASSPSPAPTVIADITSITEEGEQPLTDSGSAAAAAAGGAGGFFSNIGNSIANAYKNDPFFIWYIIGAAAILVIIIVLTITAKKRHAKEKRFETQFEVEEDLTVLEDISITPHSKDEAPKSEPRLIMSDFEAEEESAPRKIVHMMDDTIMYNYRGEKPDATKTEETKSDRIEEQIEIEDEEEEADMSSVADFEKDISKYTQQPGRDVNDISKNTVNAYDGEGLSEEIEKTRILGKSSEDVPSWKTQGTRMSRHKKKK